MRFDWLVSSKTFCIISFVAFLRYKDTSFLCCLFISLSLFFLHRSFFSLLQRSALFFVYRSSSIVDCCVITLHETSTSAISYHHWLLISWQILSRSSWTLLTLVKVFERAAESYSLYSQHFYSLRKLLAASILLTSTRLNRRWFMLETSWKTFNTHFNCFRSSNSYFS